MAAKELYDITLFYDANLVSYYRLEGNGNDGKGTNNGTPSNVTFGSSYGKFGQGGLFNGSNSKISMPDDSIFRITSNFTIAGWFKTSETGAWKNIFSCFAQTAYPAGYYIQVTTGNKISLVSGRNTGVGATDFKAVTGSTTVTDGNWHFAVGVWDGSYLRIYLDGSEEANVEWIYAPGYMATSYNRIGVQGNTDVSEGNYFNGSIDECFLFNRALSATEISKLYSGGYNSRFSNFIPFFM